MSTPASAPTSPRARHLGDAGAAANRARRLLRKFGPFTLIVLLLFGIKYFLVAIYVNIHHIKRNVAEQCEVQASGALRREFEFSRNEHWSQHKMVGRGSYGFVQWSAYRVSASHVVAVGFGAAVLRDHREATTCAWHGADGKSIPGEPKILYPDEKSDKHQYETVLLSCAFTGPVVTHLGGHATVTVDKEAMAVYHEQSNSAEHRDLHAAAGAFRHKASFCTLPIAEAVDGERLREWLDLHRSMGAEHVVAYDAGGLDKKAMAHLTDYVREGFLEVTPMRAIAQFDISSHGKVAAMHDCLFRSALTSNWVVYLDWDDVLMLQSPRFLSILLDDHKDLAWMSFGCRVFSTKLCLEAKAVEGSSLGWGATGGAKVPLPYERMVYHWPHFLCQDEGRDDKNLCTGDSGMRYLIVNPNKVSVLRASSVVEPAEGGLDLSAEDVRHDRFEDLHKEGVAEEWCREPHSAEDKVEWWERSDEVARLARETREELARGTKREGSEAPPEQRRRRMR